MNSVKVHIIKEGENVAVDHPLGQDVKVGAVIACQGHHFDENRFDEFENPSTFYGIATDWQDERFGPETKGWIQVKVLADGDYCVNPEELSQYPEGIYYDFIVSKSQLRVVYPPGSDDHTKEIDEYGKSPMRFFVRNEDQWEFETFDAVQRCKKCRDPGCLVHNDYLGIVPLVIDQLKQEKNRHLKNRSKRFRGYQKIVRSFYGMLSEGERRKCGACVEFEMHKHFPERNGKRVGYISARVTNEIVTKISEESS